jgi:hypothetical protein
MRVFLCLFVFLAFSCSNSDSEPSDLISDNCVPVIFDNSKFNSPENFGVNLDEYSINGSCLTVKLSFSGCDNDHTIEMVSDGAIAESEPPQITFDFYDQKQQDCEAYFTVDREYDLSPIQELNEGRIIIKFRNNDKFVHYDQ